ncbi:MAG: LutC/YkgG family protein [Prolixibacteraceae bacterium]
MKSAREEILEKLREFKTPVPEKPDFEEDVFYTPDEEAILTFRKNLELVSGKLHLFQSEKKLYNELKIYLQQKNKQNINCREPEIQARLSNYNISYSGESKMDGMMETALTGCEFLIAQTGSVMVSSHQPGARQIIVFPETHIVIAQKQQVIKNLDVAYRAMSEKYKGNLPSQITLITGPSRTADIEKVLTLGAHGPKELHVFLH